MYDESWIKEFPAAITICDAQGVILEMNEQSRRMFAKDGGGALIGRNVLDCHPEPARVKLQELLANRTANCYTIERNGVRKLVYQAPWHKDGRYMGLVELVIELPAELPNHLRK